MIYVSFGAKYKVGTGTDVHGSSAFGSGTVAGADGKIFFSLINSNIKNEQFFVC
jgi:hypothetical protein